MYQRLYDYLEKYDILYNLQFDFCERMSTSHALMSISELIRKSIDSKEFGCVIFIDLKNTVNHSNLLSKLYHYGIRGTANDWFKSYISDREQFVTLHGHNSTSLPITCGVPHGSVLVPLLFTHTHYPLASLIHRVRGCDNFSHNHMGRATSPSSLLKTT